MRGAQPAIQQQICLDAFKRLYEAKGFNVASLLAHLCVHVVGSWLGRCGCLLVGTFLSLGMAVYMVSSLLRPDGTVRLPWTSSLASSTAMRCSFSYRRTAWCICGMSRPTAPRAPSRRCKTGQQTCAHAHQFLADLGLGSHLDLMVNPKMMMTGVNGHTVGSGVMMTVGDLGRRPCRQDAMLQLRPAGPTIRRTRLTSFSFVFALRHHRWAAITSCFARAVGLKKLPYVATMFCTRPFLALRTG